METFKFLHGKVKESGIVLIILMYKTEVENKMIINHFNNFFHHNIKVSIKHKMFIQQRARRSRFMRTDIDYINLPCLFNIKKEDHGSLVNKLYMILYKILNSRNDSENDLEDDFEIRFLKKFKKMELSKNPILYDNDKEIFLPFTYELNGEQFNSKIKLKILELIRYFTYKVYSNKKIYQIIIN
jgi:hypothetical protein